MTDSTPTVAERITAYLAGGGLFNPEYANHDAVRDLLIDARSNLAAAPQPASDAEPTEREKVLAAIDKTADEEVAALALDAARDTDFYAEAEAAFRAKFSK